MIKTLMLMFQNLSKRLNILVNKLKDQGRLSESNIKDAIRSVRVALIEADVSLPVIKDFIEQTSKKCLGEKINKSLSPGQTFISIVKKELEDILGSKTFQLNLSAQPPAVIIVCGLQGSGKTTTVIKLANFLKESQKKKVLVSSCDVYRPAAMQQLQILAQKINVDYYSSNLIDPLKIAKNSFDKAKKDVFDVLIIDTAGRLEIDVDMMREISNIYNEVNPIETLFVADSMIGQNAANIAKKFNEIIPITGIILTKMDSDSRGGAALSISKITDRPIKFIGTGEKFTALEIFHPDRIASQILGMGDIISVIENIKKNIDDNKIKQPSKSKDFNLNDFKEYLTQMENIGGIKNLLLKMPQSTGLSSKVDEKKFKKIKSIIDSMTQLEKTNPGIIKSSRKIRIAKGSGTTVQHINQMLKEFSQIQKIMKKMKGKKVGGFFNQGRKGLMKNFSIEDIKKNFM